MATYTSNYAWTKPGGNDQVDISVLNGNLDSQDAIMHKAFTNMAQAFSELSTYAVGDIVLYDNELYKCHTAVTTPGSWTGSTNWQVYKLSEGGGGGTSNYNDLTNKPSINGSTLSGNKTTSDLGINATNVMMSDGVTSVEGAVDGLVSDDILFSGLISDSELTTYSFVDEKTTNDYVFIAIALTWYNGHYSDNVVVIPSSEWNSSEYLKIHRHGDDTSGSYITIATRSSINFTAQATTGVSVRIHGIIKK